MAEHDFPRDFVMMSMDGLFGQNPFVEHMPITGSHAKARKIKIDYGPLIFIKLKCWQCNSRYDSTVLKFMHTLKL